MEREPACPPTGISRCPLSHLRARRAPPACGRPLAWLGRSATRSHRCGPTDRPNGAFATADSKPDRHDDTSPKVRRIPQVRRNRPRTWVPAQLVALPACSRQAGEHRLGNDELKRAFARGLRHADGGVPPGGVGDQCAGIRSSGPVAPPKRGSNSLQQDASWTAASAEIVMGLEPERVPLDPLHHDVGHDPADRTGGPVPVRARASPGVMTTTSACVRRQGCHRPRSRSVGGVVEVRREPLRHALDELGFAEAHGSPTISFACTPSKDRTPGARHSLIKYTRSEAVDTRGRLRTRGPRSAAGFLPGALETTREECHPTKSPTLNNLE